MCHKINSKLIRRLLCQVVKFLVPNPEFMKQAPKSVSIISPVFVKVDRSINTTLDYLQIRTKGQCIFYKKKKKVGLPIKLVVRENKETRYKKKYQSVKKNLLTKSFFRNKKCNKGVTNPT